ISTSISIAERIRSIDPSIRIVFGGYGVSFESARFLQLSDAIDALVVGEGELTLDELLRTWESNGDLRQVPGIV
ncbi:cobalamin-dependent protein, partial [Ideonella sp. B508-1]|uniref:cobalamin-dependent protein n=1 Tax=Ideonella sp. B508-1 TaxID=137716 RepID=UPI00190186CB